jgi:hypothetical protein
MGSRDLESLTLSSARFYPTLTQPSISEAPISDKFFSMAANNYYSSFNNQNTTYEGAGNAHGRLDAPLPSVPHSSPSNNRPVSPIHSPFNDYTYPAPHPPPKEGGSYPRPYDSDASFPHSYNNEADPFADNIPLQPQTHKPQLYATSSPTGAMAEAELGPDGKNNKRVGRQGWFKGKITYAVFVLSVIQIVVFIAEIAKNGIFPLPLCQAYWLTVV